MTLPVTLEDLADRIGAQLVGDGSLALRGAAHPALAEGPGILALAMDAESEGALPGTKAAAAAVAEGREALLAGFKGGLVAKRPRYALAQLLAIFDRPPEAVAGVHPSAVVDPAATLGPGVSIGPLAHVGARAAIGARTRLLAQASVAADAVLGEDCLIHSGARIGERCRLGHRVIVQPNAVIGGDGFSYVTPEKGSVESARESAGRIDARNLAIARINSIGHVEIGDDAEIGAGTCVDRGTVGATRIGRGTKIDNLVQVAHNCTIGENCVLAGMVGLSGSVTLGDRVVLAGGVGVKDHVTIGDDAIVTAGSGVITSIPPRQVWYGAPARPRDEMARHLLDLARLPRLIREVAELKRRLDEAGAKNG